MDRIAWGLAAAVVILLLTILLIARKRRQKPEAVRPTTYGGPIRVTVNGRDMKIIQKEDGSFERVEENKNG